LPFSLLSSHFLTQIPIFAPFLAWQLDRIYCIVLLLRIPVSSVIDE
jgi:hypothetical protein